MRKLNKLLMLVTFVFFTAFTFAQTSVNGTVTADDGSALPGVTVMVKGTTVGTVSDANGKYKIEAPAGAQFLVFSYVGMATQEVAVKAGTVDVTMLPENAELVEIFVVADRAKERETPVAFSDVDKKDIEQQLGSRDLPLVMNMTPSVYSTAGGGGAGDARINVRGFNQRNVAIMINGVPVNDMENGWVYWSNWDGVADATSSIQMQRGLSAVNLATPSIGGTMNIITSPADKKAGGTAKLEYGSGDFMKMTLSGNTGLINDKFALSASLVGKQGSGLIDATFTKAFAYYLGSSYKVNKNHKLELFVVGAAQLHGQNLYKQNVAAYSHDYATELGADDSTLLKFPEADASVLYPNYSDAKAGRFYNENWSPITVDYTGNQWWNGKEHSRNNDNYMSERENFYHKPLANLNWYATWSPKVKQYTTLYYSGGTGGGSGTYGHMQYNYNAGIYDSPSRFVSWDETYNNNTASDTAFGILRNSVNNQWTIGAISRAQILFSDKFKAQIGVDWRTAKIDHFREVRDLVGGKFFYYDGNEFDSGSDYNKVLGDKIAYHFTNTVDWMGYFAQAEYNTSKFTAYGTFGHSFIKYTYTNHFKKAEGSDNE
ncbi:MAG: TonB-dependent receptor, partial [Bacteroidetes bacterium]